MTLPPCLIIESIEVDEDQAAAALRIGPRHARFVIGFSIPDFIEYKETVSMLDRPQRARRALIEVMTRAYRREPVNLPMDLSDTVRGADEPWPLRTQPEVSVPPIDVQITKVERDAQQPDVTTIQMAVMSVPTVVIVDNRGHQRQALTLFRFVRGVHPWQLTDAEAEAMLSAIAAAVETGIIA